MSVFTPPRPFLVIGVDRVSLAIPLPFSAVLSGCMHSPLLATPAAGTRYYSHIPLNSDKPFCTKAPYAVKFAGDTITVKASSVLRASEVLLRLGQRPEWKVKVSLTPHAKNGSNSQHALTQALTLWSFMQRKCANSFASHALSIPSDIHFSCSAEDGNVLTLVGFGEKTSMEEMLSLLLLLRDREGIDTAENKNWHRKVSEAFRVQVPSDFLRKLQRFGYALRERFWNDISEARKILLEINQKKMDGKALSEDDNTNLQHASEIIDRSRSQLLDVQNIVFWLMQNIDADASARKKLSTTMHDFSSLIRGVVEPINFVREDCVRGEILLPEDIALLRSEHDVAHLEDVFSQTRALLVSDLHHHEVKYYYPYQEMDRVSFKERDHLFSFNDILLNLVSNGARYHNSNLPAGERKVETNTRILADGSLEITVTDNGMGMSAGFVERRLGQFEAREVKVDLPESHGIGVSSVISTLNRLGSGPLWVKSIEGQGTSFRFTLPASLLNWEGEISATEGAPSSLQAQFQQNLDDGFIVPHASLPVALGFVFDRVPAYAYEGEQRAEQVREAIFAGEASFTDHDQTEISLAAALAKRIFSFPRLEMVLRLLAGAQDLENILLIDNGPADNIGLAVVAANLGMSVVVKEPNAPAVTVHKYRLAKHSDVKAKERIKYAVEADDIAAATPAHIVAWTNPFPGTSQFIQRSITPLGRSIDSTYPTRDVAVGAYLVFQSEQVYVGMEGKSDFEKVFDMRLPGQYDETPHLQFLFPTTHFHEGSMLFQIYRRIR